jgi:hypothetical protein
MSLLVTGVDTPDAGVGCPSWGTYLFAWDGNYTVGGADTDKACLNSGGEVIDGTNGGGTFGTDTGTIWTYADAGDSLDWTVDSGDIDWEDAAGITVWVEEKHETSTGYQAFYQLVGDAEDFVEGLFINVTGKARHYTHPNGNNELVTTAGGLAEDFSSYNIIGMSWKASEEGVDHVISEDTTWGDGDDDEDDDDHPAFGDGVIGTFRLGCDIGYCGTSDDYSVRKIVVISGYKAACPF